MKTSILKTTLFLFAIFLAALGTLRAGPEYKQPGMMHALDLLRDARKSDHPLPLLNNARETLKNAVHNKGGYRAIAVGEVEKAIVAAEAGEHRKMEEKIDAAIAAVRTGMAEAP
jgi:hypothetical protein